ALVIGLPVGLQMGAEVGVFALVGLLAGRLGAGSLAAHQIAISLASFTFCAAVGVGQAGSVRVGWAVGARDPSPAPRSGFAPLRHYFVGLPIAIALGIFGGMGVIGLWWGLCAGLTAVAAALVFRFLRLSSRDIAPLEGHPGPQG